MKNTFLLLMLAFLSINIQAQDLDERIPQYETKIIVGSALNSTMGTGLSYGVVHKKHGITLSFLPIYINANDSNQNDESVSILNIGLSYNYFFRKNNIVDFSMKAGVQRTSGSIFDFDVEEPSIHFGIAPEISFHVLKELDFNISLGYGLYNVQNNLSSSLSAGVGLYYNIYK